jgi:hypothetical protein
MKSLRSKKKAVRLRPPARSLRWTARVALVVMIMQITALGHWNFGPFHSDTSDLASHAAHCHANVTGCAGESSFVGTYIENPLTTVMPVSTLVLPMQGPSVPRGIIPAQPDQPPRST